MLVRAADQGSAPPTPQEWRQLGARLRAAREASGFTQENAAEFLQVSRPTVSQIEAGKTRLDSLTLRQLATLYRRPIESFFGPTEPRAATDDLVMKKVAGLAPTDRAVVTQFLQFCRNLAFVRRLLGRTRRERASSRPIGTRARKYAAEVAAKEERDLLGLADAPIGERLFDLLETLGLAVYRAPLNDPRLSGLLVNHPEAGPVIFVNASQSRWRQVFTAAHEFGHYLFHRSDQPVACRIFTLAGKQEALDITAEEFVNAFTSEFLMPEDGIKRLLVEMGAASDRLNPEDVVRLQRHFGVSFQAMLYRLLRLRLLSEVDVQRMKEETRPVALAWKLGYMLDSDEFGEPEVDELDLARRFPREYIALVLEAFDRREISNGRAAELLELNRGAFDRFYRVLRRASGPRAAEEDLEHVVA